MSIDVASMLTGKPVPLSGAQKAGRALSALSAGLMGKGPEYLKTIQEQDAAAQTQQATLSKERLTAMAQDAQRVDGLLKANDFQGALRLIDNRINAIGKLGGDPSDTQRIRGLIASGDISTAQAEIGEFLSAAYGYGLIEAPKPIPQNAISPNGQVALMGSNGAISAQTIPGYTPQGLEAPDSYRALEMRAEASGLTPGTPAYQDFMRSGGSPQQSFELITPEMAAQLGLPADKQFQRNTVNGQISQVGSGPAVQVNTGQATEGERTAGILANRLDFAQSQINDVVAAAPQAQSPGTMPTIFGTLGLDYLARVSNPAERQIIEAAQDDMLDAALTLGTGAAYTAEQFQAYKRSYFPQLGDDQKTIEAKAVRLSNLLDAAYKKAGRGAPEQRRSSTPAAQPEAASPELTPDEQAELAELRARYVR